MPAKDETNTTDKVVGIVASAGFWLFINTICFMIKIKNVFKHGRHVKRLEEEPNEISTEINMLNNVRS